MWDLRNAHPLGRLSKRKVIPFVTAAIVATFAYLFILIPMTHATPDQATWVSGNQLSYQSNTYSGPLTASSGDGTGFTPGTTYYVHVENSGSADSLNTSSSTETADVISFAPKVNVATATSAQYGVFTYTPPKKLTDEQKKQTIPVENQTSIGSGATQTGSCDGSITAGMGWIICPVTNFLSGGMDYLFHILESFLTVRPVSTSPTDALFRAWSFMRNFANVAFVIAFLVIIYSQLTNAGISNYGIKKLLPRIMIAALLVNLSYWICAIFVDISNILGVSMQQLFIQMRNGILGNSGNSWTLVSWQDLGSTILSGGTAIGVGAVATTLAFTTATAGSLYFLLPVLLGALLSVLVALLVMAARQALVTILVILSPIAFVMFLLPNTEKWFHRWRETFMTMLIIFPMFSIVFGGAQLAGTAIIQNANSINVIILGMLVQVAPVMITPLLLRLGGSILNNVAGMVKTPHQGMLDRTRKWANERGEEHRARLRAQAYDAQRNGTLRRFSRNNAIIQRDNLERRRSGWKKANEEISESLYAGSAQAHAIHAEMKRADDYKHTNEAEADTIVNNLRTTDAGWQVADIRRRAAEQLRDNTGSESEIRWNELQANRSDNLLQFTEANLATSGLRDQILQDTTMSRVNASRLNSAQAIQQQNYANEITRNSALAGMAGGIDNEGGLIKAKARAISELTEALNKDSAAGVQLLSYDALQNGMTSKDYAMRIAGDVNNGIGNYNPVLVEAAVESLVTEGQIPVLEQIRMSHNYDQAMVSRVFAKNQGVLKEKGGFHLATQPNLAYATVPQMRAAQAGTLGDTVADNLGTIKVAWINDVSSNIDQVIANGDSKDLQKAFDNIHRGLSSPRILERIGDRREAIENIYSHLAAQGYTPTKPVVKP